MGNWLSSRCDRTGALDDLDEAIRNRREAVKATPHNHPDRARMLNNLGISLRSRYDRTGALEDLEEAIYNLQQAIKATLHDHPDRAGRLSNLSSFLTSRFDRLGLIEDLEEAIRKGQEAVKATPHDHPDRARMLNNLGISLRSRYDRTGALEDLEEANCNVQEAVKATNHDHPDRAGMLNNVGCLLGSRYETVALEDLEDGIRNMQEAIKATPHNHRNRARMLNSLGTLLSSRYHRTNTLEDLEEAIRSVQEAIKATPHDHPDRASMLNDLSSVLGYRYGRTGAMEDLEEAIRNAQEAVKITPHDHPDRARRLNTLASQLGFRYHRKGALKDLEEAIRNAQEAVKATSHDHPNRANMLCTLSSKLGSRYDRTGALDDLEEAIRKGQEGVKAMSHDHHSRATCLTNLGKILRSRYDETGALDDLEEAIRNAQKAIRVTPHDHPDRASYLNNLGISLSSRYQRTGALEDLEEAKALYIAAAEMDSALPLVRIESAQKAGLLAAAMSEWAQAGSILQVAVELLPRISPRSLRRDDQQYALSRLPGLSSLAASAILQANRTPSEALATLENGRGVMAGLVISSRSDVTDLAMKYPDLHDQYIKLRDMISSPLPTVDTGSEIIRIESIVDSVSRRNEDVRKLEMVEKKIRKIPEFQNFQLPPSPADLIGLSGIGPIVSFNVTQVRSDAFIVTQRGIRALSLPDLKLETLIANVKLLTGPDRITNGDTSTIHERNKKLRIVLKWLWDVAVHPVLQDVGLLTAKASRRLPRIWWVTSGLVGLTPLHAAGHKWGRSTENTASHVVSSYIPTFKALAYAREKSLKSPVWPPQRFLIVKMPKTTGWDDLDVTKEALAIRESITRSGIPVSKVLDTPSKDEVLDELKISSLVHFACHGESDSEDPSSSGLFFKDGHDGNPQHLTVRELITTSLQQAQMAYLSACSTAGNSSQNLVDEVIHIASAFQLVGFPNVIGTIWEADDIAANDVAQIFYRELVSNKDAFAYALHDAVHVIRAGQVGGLRLRKSASDNVTAWAPFIHLGC